MTVDRAKLPPSLKRWTSALTHVSPELTRSLGPWITRFSAVFGALHVRADAGRAEPDGYDGLSRRGAPERMLSTEWLLATEIPEEFERRTAMSEIGYLSLARIEPRKAAGSLALLDAGPSQLGGVRVHQLAALVALSERASRVGARFAFTMMAGAPDEAPLYDALHDASLVAWAESRRATEVSDDEASRWVERARAMGFEDRWVIGGRRCVSRRRFEAWSKVMLEEPIRRDARRVRAAVRRAGAPEVEVELEPVGDALSARLLRDPRALSKIERAAEWPLKTRERMATGNLVWSASGHRIFARNQHGALMVFPIPRTPREGGGRPTVVFPRGAKSRILAVAWTSRRLVIFEAEDGKLMFGDWCGDRFPLGAVGVPDGSFASTFGAMLDPAQAAPLGALVAWPQHSKRPNFVGISPDGRLLTLERTDNVYALNVAQEGALAAASSYGRVAVAAHVAGTDRVALFNLTSRAHRSEIALEGSPSELLLGAAPLWWRAQFTEVAARVGDEWVVKAIDAAPWRRRVGVGARVLAVVPEDATRREAALVTLRNDGTLLALEFQRSTVVLRELTEAAVQASVSPDGDRIAWLNEEGVLSVYSRARGGLLMQWPRREAP